MALRPIFATPFKSPFPTAFANTIPQGIFNTYYRLKKKVFFYTCDHREIENDYSSAAVILLEINYSGTCLLIILYEIYKIKI